MPNKIKKLLAKIKPKSSNIKYHSYKMNEAKDDRGIERKNEESFEKPTMYKRFKTNFPVAAPLIKEAAPLIAFGIVAATGAGVGSGAGLDIMPSVMAGGFSGGITGAATNIAINTKSRERERRMLKEGHKFREQELEVDKRNAEIEERKIKLKEEKFQQSLLNQSNFKPSMAEQVSLIDLESQELTLHCNSDSSNNPIGMAKPNIIPRYQNQNNNSWSSTTNNEHFQNELQNYPHYANINTNPFIAMAEPSRPDTSVAINQKIEEEAMEIIN